MCTCINRLNDGQCLKLTPLIGDGNENDEHSISSSLYCLKLTPLIGDGNSKGQLLMHDIFWLV